jgi:hypothetical protein
MPTKTLYGQSNDTQMDWPGVDPLENARDLGVVPLFILDAYHVHMMGSIDICSQALGI